MSEESAGDRAIAVNLESGRTISGILNAYVAFDWGEEIYLDQAAKLITAAPYEFPRRRRTPPSFAYRPLPLHRNLEPVSVSLAEIGDVQAAAGLTLFDFGAVSFVLRIPFCLPVDALLRLAGSLADPTFLVKKARTFLQRFYDQLLPALKDPSWQSDLSEDYFVFQLGARTVDTTKDAAWLAGLIHLESGPLSKGEVTEALRLQISYSPDDVFIADWGAAILVDTDCEETLQAIEFANLQLLEFRHIDNRLDESLAAASRTIEPWTRSRLPFWKTHSGALRMLGELKVEANTLFERTENALKLVGDPYLARVYRLVATRFHLDTWEQNIQRKLEVAEGVYQAVSDQASHFRTEFLEVIVVVLILIEIVLAFRH